MEDRVQPSSGAPTPAAYDPGKRPARITAAYGCSAGCGLLLVILAVLIVTTAQKRGALTDQADVTAREFMHDLQVGELDKAYSRTSPAWRRRSSLAELKTFAGSWRAQQGHFRAISLRDSSWFSDSGGTRVDLLYYIQGTRSDEQVRISIAGEGKGAAVQTCTFTPPSAGRSP